MKIAESGIIFPDETKPNPQIEKLQESVDKIQDSVDEIKFQLANLSDDLKYEFDGQKVANRIQEIERQKTAFEKMFNYLKYINQDGKDIDLMTYYELKNYAIEAFGSVDKMRQSIQNFFTDYYKGDAVATRTYGESYKLIAEEIFPWRYQSAAFMETLIGQELDFAAKLFTIAGIMLDPNDNTNMLFDMMIQETMKNSVDAERLEKLAECSVKDKTEANWLKIYKTGCLPSEKTDGYVRMLSTDDYEKILDFYKNHNLVITDSCLCNIVEKGNGIVGRFKINGKNKQEINLFNIFWYDAGFKFQTVKAKDAKFACLKSKEAMAFIVENERTDYGMEGPWYDLKWMPVKFLVQNI